MAVISHARLDAVSLPERGDGRTVRLTGLVPSAAASDAAEWDAWYVFGVDDVINEIETGA